MIKVLKLDTPQKWAYTLLVCIGIIAVYFLILDRFAPSTDNATIQAYVINVSSYINGTVDEVYVHENQQVKKEQTLFRLDSKAYELALAAAENNLTLTIQQEKENLQRVDEAQQKLNTAKAERDYQKNHHDALGELFKQGAISKDLFDKETALLVKSEDAVIEAEKALIFAKQVVGPSINGVNIHVIQAQNAIDAEKLNLTRTTIYAPKEGYVTNLQLQKGSFVTQGQSAMTLVDRQSFWIQANLKENNLNRIEVGQPVLVSIKAYPGKIFKGSIQSIGWGVQTPSAGNGVALPTIEKTNNWINLAQRFPVNIKVQLPESLPIRVGATAIVTVETTSNPVIRGLSSFMQWIRSNAQFFS
jgi:multidrug resistance efflux pump